MSADQKKIKFLILDGNALLHRAYHALPTTLSNKRGEVLNAVFGFSAMLLKVIEDLKPTHIVVAWDSAGPTFRHKKYKEYKANRETAPSDLYAQMPRIKEILKTFNIPSFEKKGYEADDLVGTIAKKAPLIGETYIVTGDMDCLQLIKDHVKVFAFKRGISDDMIYDERAVTARYGLSVSQMIDYKALRGDPSDNIPGVRGIGEKTASELLKEFHTLEKLYAYIETEKALKEKRVKERIALLLREHKKGAFLSKMLATIKTDVKIGFSFKNTKFGSFSSNKIEALFRELEFRSLMKKVPIPQGGAEQTLFSNADDGARALARKRNPHYHLIADKAAFVSFFENLKKQSEFAIDTEATSADALSAQLLGISFCFKKGEAYYVAISSKEGSSFLKALAPVLESPSCKKIGHNLKYDMQVLENAGIYLQGIAFDTMVAAYMLNPGARGLGLKDLAYDYFKHKMSPIESLIGPKGKKQKNMSEVALEDAAEYAAQDSDYTFRLYKELEKKLSRHVSFKLFYDVEMPLVCILSRMERNGVKIDRDFLNQLSKEFENRQNEIDKSIYEFGGGTFNINSPIQLQEVLFEKIGIAAKKVKRTKTGVSTAAFELEKLKGCHPIIDLIIRHRELAKLRSTYVDALPKLVGEDGRIHTSFNQTVTATGRLSSSDPNLQNIPIRTEDGRLIREAFIAEEGNALLAADYSQIELRVVAHLSRDTQMIEAFDQGKDIHTHTAALLFKVGEEEVTPAMRRKAKEANFGVLYGLGARGLSQRMEVSYDEAKMFIEEYFSVFSGVKQYIDEVRALALSLGYVETILGRRRYIPELRSLSQELRASGERMAVNMPIQGTASDIMKLAMIKVDNAIKFFKDARMILQVHDELVFEVKESHAEDVAKVVKESMEEAYKLHVPLVVDVKAGQNWAKMKEAVSVI